MDPITAIIALIGAGERAMNLAKRLSEVKKRADSEGRAVTAEELAPFKAMAHADVAELDKILDDLEAEEPGG